MSTHLLRELDRQLQYALDPAKGEYDPTSYWLTMNSILEQIVSDRKAPSTKLPSSIELVYFKHMGKWHSAYSADGINSADLKCFIHHAEVLNDENIRSDFLRDFNLERKLRSIGIKAALVTLPILALIGGYWAGTRSCLS